MWMFWLLSNIKFRQTALNFECSASKRVTDKLFLLVMVTSWFCLSNCKQYMWYYYLLNKYFGIFRSFETFNIKFCFMSFDAYMNIFHPAF